MPGVNHLFIRFLYLLITWIIALKPLLSMNGIQGVNPTAFYAPFFLFFLPLIVDYWGFELDSKLGKTLRILGMYSTIFAIVFLIIATYTDGSLSKKSGTLFNLKIEIYWYILGFWILLSLIDWITFTFHPTEVAFRKKISAVVRKNKDKFKKDITVQERISLYKRLQQKTEEG